MESTDYHRIQRSVPDSIRSRRSTAQYYTGILLDQENQEIIPYSNLSKKHMRCNRSNNKQLCDNDTSTVDHQYPWPFFLQIVFLVPIVSLLIADHNTLRSGQLFSAESLYPETETMLELVAGQNRWC